MSRRRVERLEGSLFAKEAVKHWLGEAHAFGTLPAYVGSLVEQPDTAQPYIALPMKVERAVWDAMKRERRDFLKEVTREAVAATAFLLRLAIGLNAHIEEVLRVERLRHAALYWWSRALDSGTEGKDGVIGSRTEWQRGIATLRGSLLGTEQARAATEARYLDGYDCLLPDLAAQWQELLQAADHLDPASSTDEDASEAEQRVRRLVLMARADGLEAGGHVRAADEIASRVAVALELHQEGRS